MLRFFSYMAITIALTLPTPAKAECNPSETWADFEKEYKHWRDHRKDKKHRHKKRRGHCGGKKHHRHHGHRPPPPELPPYCMICENTAQPKPTPTDKGFCTIPKAEFRSEKFLIGDQPHILSMLIVNNELVIDLAWLNNERNVADDGKYIAFPEGFAKPAEPTQLPVTQFPDKAQLESKSFSCNNTRSLVWDSNSGRVIPSFFGGRMNMVYTKDVIYTETSLTTDLSSTAYMPIQLKKVPDKKTARSK